MPSIRLIKHEAVPDCGSYEVRFSKPMMVDIDTVAPGVVERYSYLCAGRSAGAAFVQRILQ